MTLSAVIFALGLVLQGWVSWAFVAGQRGHIRRREVGDALWLRVPFLISIVLAASGSGRFARALPVNPAFGVVAGALSWTVVGAVPVWWHNNRAERAEQPIAPVGTPKKNHGQA